MTSWSKVYGSFNLIIVYIVFLLSLSFDKPVIFDVKIHHVLSRIIFWLTHGFCFVNSASTGETGFDMLSEANSFLGRKSYYGWTAQDRTLGDAVLARIISLSWAYWIIHITIQHVCIFLLAGCPGFCCALLPRSNLELLVSPFRSRTKQLEGCLSRQHRRKQLCSTANRSQLDEICLVRVKFWDEVIITRNEAVKVNESASGRVSRGDPQGRRWSASRFRGARPCPRPLRFLHRQMNVHHQGFMFPFVVVVN